MKKAKISSNLHDRLDKKTAYYEVVFGNQGEYRLIDKKNIEYVRITEEFCRVKGIKDEAKQANEWVKLLNDSNQILRESVKIELEKMKKVKK